MSKIGNWWDTDMVDAGQAMYIDPQLAMELATTPDRLLMNEEQSKNQMRLAREEKAGFWQNAVSTIKDFGGKADNTLSNLPGWGLFKNYMEVGWYPIDKLAQGARWLYSEGFSQPVSTTILQFAKEDMDVGSLFSGADWAESYKQAEHISPGQAFMNAEMTAAASEDFGALSIFTDQVEAPNWQSRIFTGKDWQYTGPLNKQEMDTVKRQKERFLYDTKFWQDRDGETYNKGSGALDFFFVIFGDPTTPFVGAVSNTIKAARSAQFVDDGLGLVRTRGNTLDVAARALPGAKGAPQTAEEFFVADKNMNKFYDWVMEPSITGAERKTAAEIAAHPVWGRGRRTNPFANQFADRLSTMPRDDMNLVLRFAAGDNQAASILAGKGTRTLDDIGRLAENRVMLSSLRTDDEFLSYFAAKEDLYPGTPVPSQGTELFEPPFPRPTTPGPRQSGWDARWGDLAARAELGQQAAASIRGGLTGGVRPLGPVGGINADDIAKANQWKEARIKLIDDELKTLSKESASMRNILEWNMGKEADEFLPAGSKPFGTMDRAYRAGGLRLLPTTPESTAGNKFARQVADRKGRFATQGMRNGMYGTPMRFVQSFGDRVPEGRINHTDEDAPNRLMDMLKQVPGLGPETRAAMMDRYNTAGDKTAKSRMLQQLNTEIVHHIAGRVHGLDPEVAQVLSEITKVGIDATLNKLIKGGSYHSEKQFTGAVAERGGEMRTVDHVFDGEAWVLSPLAKTQLDQSDTLLPILELNRAIGRASNSMKTMRNAGVGAHEVGKLVLDPLNTVWKAATLLRPGYVPRMISDEAILSAVKFGFMSRIAGDLSKGAANFVRNRAVYMSAISGKGSYVPTTGKGIESRFATVRLEDEAVGENILAHIESAKLKLRTETDPLKRSQLEAEIGNLKVDRIKVNKALPIVQVRLNMEQELKANLNRDVKRWNSEIKELEKSQIQTDILKAEALKMKVANATDAIADHDMVIREFGDYAEEIMRVALESSGRRIGEGEFKLGERTLFEKLKRTPDERPGVPEAFSKEWENPIPRSQISSDASFQSLYARAENIDMGRFAKTGSWTTIAADRPEHMQSWLRAVNFQFRQDDVFRMVAEDPTGKKAIAWLRTPEGRNHLADLGPRAQDHRQLVEDIKFTLDKYLPVPALQQKMAKGEEITAAELAANIPKAEFPTVHGEEIKYLTRMFAKDANESVVDRIIAAGFNRLGSIPSDLMSRHPVYSRLFEARMRAAIGQDAAYKKSIGKDASYTSKELEMMKEKADKLARKDLSQIVYDPNRTMGGEALRFLFPFFNAHADALARWGGMLGERPQQFTKLAKIYNAPVSANMVTDKYGNVLDSDGTVTIKDPVTGKFIEKHKVTIEDRVLRLRLPWQTADKGTLPIKLSAINTILPGDPWFHPGSGPLVQVPASQLAKASPTAGQFLEWSKIIPYGPTDATTAFTPKYMRTVYDRFKAGDPDGEAYQAAFLAVYNKRVADYKNDGTKFTIKEVEEEARQFLNLEIWTAWVSPAQTQQDPLTGSPYQFYVDEYKKMQETYGQDARDMFMSKYPDYFEFTASLNKSMGIAATAPADAMAQKYKDQIELDPDMAPLWIGNVYNGGPFNTSIYKKQLEQSFGGEWVREKITAKNAIEANQTAQGWEIWSKLKMELDATLIRAGFTGYSQAGAEGFNAVRQNAIENLSKQFPAWGEAYMVTDRGKIPKRIESFKRMANDEDLLNDPMRSEIKVLRQYLARREVFKQALNQRGAKQLSFGLEGPQGERTGIGENADIAEAWDYEVTSMINSNIAFGQLYNRYLSNDHLQ